MKKGESGRHWMKRVSEIINSSQELPPISILMAMERNCTFNPLSWKLGRMKDSLNQGIPITIGEIMAGANKHAATNNPRPRKKSERAKVVMDRICRGYGTRVPTWKINVAHQGIAQRADSKSE